MLAGIAIGQGGNCIGDVAEFASTVGEFAFFSYEAENGSATLDEV